MNKTLKKNSSFTLIELLVVIVIIGILAGLVTIAATSFINNSHNARMVAELAGISKKLIGETEFPAGNFCMEDGSDEAKKLLDFLEMEKAPAHPLYNGGTHLTTNECFLYFSDGEHYSIRVPTVGNKGYLIQESRNPNPQGIQEKCEEGWIPFGNRCVMKYEAKNVGGVATSQATVAPWGSITQENAKKKCEEIGAHLMTNAEWMAMARDIEAVENNWVGTGASRVLKMGNVGDASPINADAWYGFNPTALDYEGKTGGNRSFDSPAKLVLSNGQTIWDFSGNVWEWVDEVKTNKELEDDFGAGLVDVAYEYNTQDLFKDATRLPYSMVGSLKKVGSEKGGGYILIRSIDNESSRCPAGDCSIHAFGRGGYQNDGAGLWDGSIFALILQNSPSRISNCVGFRCVR